MSKSTLIFERFDIGYVDYPSSYEASITVRDKSTYDYAPVVGKTFKLYKNGTFVKNITVGDRGSITFTDTSNAGTYTFKLVFDGDANINSAQYEWTVSVGQAMPSFSYIENTSSVKLGQPNVFKTQLWSVKQTPMANITISTLIVFENGTEKTYTAKTNSSGVATFTIPSPQTPMTATAMNTRFEGDTNHYPWDLAPLDLEWVKTDIIFEHQDITTMQYPESYNAEIKVRDEETRDSSELVGKTFKLYKQDEYVSDLTVNSQGNLAFTQDLDAGRHTFKVVFDGNATINSAQHEWIVKVTKGMVSCTCIENTQSVLIGEPNIFKIQLYSAKGIPIKNYEFSTIVVFENGTQQSYTASTDNLGIATFTIASPQSPMSAYASNIKFNESKNHYAEEVPNIDFAWVKTNFIFEHEDITQITYPESYDAKIKVRDESTYDYAPAVGKTFKLYRKGTYLYDLTVNNQGKLEFTDNLDAGSYTYKVVFNGDSTSQPVQHEWTVSVGRGRVSCTCIENTQSVRVGYPNIFKIQLYSAKGIPVKNYEFSTTVVFENGTQEPYTAITDSTGVATFTIASPQSPMSAYASNIKFNQSKNHFAEEVPNIDLEWTPKLTSKLTLQTLDIRYPHEAKVTGTLSDSTTNEPIANNSVKFYIDDEYIEEQTTDEDGKVIFINSKPPKTYPDKFTYKLVFEGNEEYNSVTTSKNGGYYRNKTKLTEITNDNEAYVGTANTVTMKLTSNEGNILKNSTVKYQYVFEDSNGNEVVAEATNGSIKTDTSGEVTLELTCSTVGTGTISWHYVGNSVQDTCDATSVVRWIPKGNITLSSKLTNTTTPTYNETIKIRGTWKNQSNLNDTLNGRTIKLYRNNTLINTLTTNSNGIVNFTDTPSPNKANDESDKYVYKLKYDGDDEREAVTSNAITLRYLNSSTIELVENPETMKAKSTATIKTKLSDNVGTLSNKTVNLNVTCVKTDGTNYELPNAVANQTKTTNSSGVASVNFQTDVAGTYTFTFNYGDEYTVESEYITTLEVSKIQTSFAIHSRITDIKVLEEGKVTLKLTDENGNNLIGVSVRKTLNFLTFDGETTSEYYKPKTTSTGNYGESTINYTPTLQGNIIGTGNWVYNGDDTYEGTTFTSTITWYKIDTTITLNTDSGDKEVTQQGKITVKLKDEYNNAIIAVPINKTLEFVTFDNKPSLESYTPQTTSTGNYGESTIYYTPMLQGDITGTCTWVYEGDGIYNSSTFSKTLKWYKIKTKITAKNITHYATRYTDIEDEEPSWNEPSPGTDPNYKNFWAKLETIDTTTDITTISGETIHFINSGGNVCAEGITNNKGIGQARYTRSYLSSTNYGVKYEGNDIFLPSNSTFKLTTLPRVETTMEQWTLITHPEGYRYKVPFSLGVTLKEDGEILPSMPVTVKYGTAKTWNLVTHSNGVARVNDFSPKNVGTVEIVAEFNVDDMIDKYVPNTYSYTLTIEKDYTILTISHDLDVYEDCRNAQINYLLTDSLDRGISDKIYIKYDDATGTAMRWLNFPVEYVTSNSSGNASYTIEPYSCIRLLQAEFKGTWCYEPIITTGDVEYDLTKTYTLNLSSSGVVELPVECELNSSNGLPNGLYDVDIEYIPPATPQGECKIYGSGQTVIPIRKKKGTILSCLTENLESEAYVPLFVTTELKNFKNEFLPNMEEISTVNGKNKSNPPHITSNEGQVTRGGYGTTNGEKITYLFKVNQTKEYADNQLEVKANITKMQPTLEPESSELEAYSRVAMTLKATLYHRRKKYDAFGFEVKKDSNGLEIHYDSLNNTYYKLQDGNKTTCTKSDYDNGTSITKTTYLAGRTVVWRGTGATTELVRATTDSKGVAMVNYSRTSVGAATIYATTDEESNYKSCIVPININTLARIQIEFEDIDFTNKHTVYKHPTKLYTHVYYKENNTLHPFANQTIVFKQTEKTLGTATTNSEGYVEITYTSTSELKLPYQVIFRGYNQYDTADKVYKIPVDKQTPQILLEVSKTSPSVGETISLKATMMEDEISGSSKISGYKLLFKDGNSNIIILPTDSDGVARTDYLVKTSGTRNITVSYDGTSSNRYNSSQKSVQISANKVNTHFVSEEGNNVSMYGLTSKSINIYLYDVQNKALANKSVSINYNNTTTTAKTDGKGKIVLTTGKYDIGTTKTASFSFAGDTDYNSCNLTVNLSWGNYLNDEQCDDLDKFDTILENWYASDGSASFGLDTNNLNNPTKCSKYEGITVGSYKRNCSPVNEGTYKNVLLRKYCNNLKTEGGYEETNKGTAVYAPTGVVLRSKHIVSSRKCTISFDIKFEYDGSNSAVDSRQYGGHFGLMSGDDNVTTAEKAPLRFEIYRNNAYGIQEGGTASGSSMAYSFQPNTWYGVDFEINDTHVKMIMYDENGNTKGYENFTSNRTFEGLYPYVFAFTNGTKIVLRRLKVTRY